ncbi:uncharacterized protein K452DRAFT_238072 [Aplosporella prunicola CBS 121167]|uniref:AAA+ ATPase domain-containing protein n=1 Tax=Aplosporella prunicola CBS 121167 TaxID=1176127 RepID=A0A6A6AVX1_9PEZI|nr:uncharacterized protein K452DRAFT_238072 [Aplosporella prunicola CBS 121167]KAF2136099.1 hypothetical protein K452DRAFT_238072 [Aplosporella prunicola CBS 121167]
MDNARDDQTGQADNLAVSQPADASVDLTLAADNNQKSPNKPKKPKASCKKHKPAKRSKKGKRAVASESDSDDSSSESNDSLSSDSSESSSSGEELARKRSSKRAQKLRKMKAKAKKYKKKPKKYETSSDECSSDSSDSSSSSESEEDTHSRRHRKKSRKVVELESGDESEEEIEDDAVAKQDQLLQLLLEQQSLQKRILQLMPGLPLSTRQLPPLDDIIPPPEVGRKKKKGEGKKSSKKALGKRGSTVGFKRVDELWDSTIHNYKLTESAEDPVDEFDAYVFTVRRKFDWENKYRNTVVDIKSKLLREALQEIMKDVKGVSLVEEQPCIDPNLLFLYLEELRTHAKKTLKARAKKEKKKKSRKRINLMIAHCKVMVRFLDEDYDETKKTLYPMLNAGNITFDLLWALFKPNTVAYTTTYGSVENPRCFKVDYATKESSFIRGDWYCIEGRYLEYDGKNYGLGDFEINVESFKGPRKITSLATYPLHYHKDCETLKKQLIERGKTFVTMTGMNYKFHKGLAFEKRKKMVAKHNVNGRVMIDPAIFRRINPNYPISLIKPKDQDALYDIVSCCDCSDAESDDEDGPGCPQNPAAEGHEEREKTKLKVIYDEVKKEHHVLEVPVDEDGDEIKVEKLDKLGENTNGEDAEGTEKVQEFTEEELLIASPVVLGFAFSEKRWMEFSISGLQDIKWNDEAFTSLVLQKDRKSIVKAMVSSHKFHAAQTIDDVVQGKGRGMVFVLHGPPGVGKTLTAEGIADYLKCPLYAVSAGELGTESWRLEQELQKIMDIAHSWGAVLLLDEADVFLEKRQVHDIHRNALVSIFLRLLEYFQGILFLTTNRVETFDDAFQSRTHIGLRYEELSTQAKRDIWRMFLRKVHEMDGTATVDFKPSDYDTLARNPLNGRQIKNAVRTAQALAIHQGEKLSMTHIKAVLDVAEDFERDLKGGTGYIDAMRSYT